jgi:two-component system, NarL family, nitrate/nitrite response regulator NarL
MKLIRILLADDHPVFRRGLRNLLESQADFRVVGEASDGAEVMKLLRKAKPDILLLDLAMPRFDGLAVLREVAAAALPVRTIVLTVAIEKEQIIETLQLGARGIVMKDATTKLVIKSIRMVMAGQYWVGRESVTDLVHYVSGLLPGPVQHKNLELTQREREILTAIVAGYTNKDIAQKFLLSEETVKKHLTHIFDKTGTSNRLELAIFAIHQSLVSTR